MTQSKFKVGNSYRTKGGHRAEIVSVDSLLIKGSPILAKHYWDCDNTDEAVVDEYAHKTNGRGTNRDFWLFDLTDTEWEAIK